jgi:hypothetical protein
LRERKKRGERPDGNIFPTFADYNKKELKDGWGKDMPMRMVQRVFTALLLSLFLLGGISIFAPTAAHADKPIVGKPIIHKDHHHGDG